MDCNDFRLWKLNPLPIIIIGVLILNTHEILLLTMCQRVESCLDDSQRGWVLMVLIKLHTIIGEVDQHHLFVSIHNVSNPIMVDVIQLKGLHSRLKVLPGFDWVYGSICGDPSE